MATNKTIYPEARVLIIMTGGTICMRHSENGLVPARGFLEKGMSPRPSFNDGSNPGTLSKMSILIPAACFPCDIVRPFVAPLAEPVGEELCIRMMFVRRCFPDLPTLLLCVVYLRR